MTLKVGDIVRSLSGHDAAKKYMVIAQLNERYVLLADGKSRSLDNPKQKNVRHIALIQEASESQKYVDDKSIADAIAKLDIVE